MSNALLPGTRCYVATNGSHYRGRVLRVTADGFYVVRLQGERGADHWHPSLVRAA